MMFFLITTVQATNLLFHGLGDQCSNSGNLNFCKKINAQCVEIGNGATTSIGQGFLEQAQQACKTIQEQYSGQTLQLIGLSQGALIARYIVTDCDFKGKVSKLVSIGGPQMGVSSVPHCGGGIICWPINTLVRDLVYTEFTQKHVGPAGYFRNNHNLQEYLNKSSFLAEINNERTLNLTRKSKVFFIFKQFVQLQGLLLIMFRNDHMIHPKETAHFQELDENDQLIPLRESEFYVKDLLGLKQLDQAKKVKFESLAGDHLEMSSQDIDEIIVPFLNE